MTAIAVPWHRSYPQIASILAGAPVSASELIDCARSLHWIRGRGLQLVPFTTPAITVAAGSNTTMRFRVQPSGVAIERRWIVFVRGSAPGASIKFRAGSGTISNTFLVDNIRDGKPTILQYAEAGLTKSTAAAELTATVWAEGSGSVHVDAIGCWELPRPALTLETATEHAVNMAALRPGQPINETAQWGLRGIAETVRQTISRRVLFQKWLPSVATTTSASYQSVFVLPVPVVASKRSITDTTTAATWAVYARVDDSATNGTIQLSSTIAADSEEITITGTDGGATALAWRSGSALGLDPEDMSTDDGIDASAGAETVQLKIKRTAGSGSIEVQGVGIWEAP